MTFLTVDDSKNVWERHQRRNLQSFNDDLTGKISLKNLKHVAKELGKNLTGEQLQEITDEANRDGVVNEQDCLSIMKRKISLFVSTASTHSVPAIVWNLVFENTNYFFSHWPPWQGLVTNLNLLDFFKCFLTKFLVWWPADSVNSPESKGLGVVVHLPFCFAVLHSHHMPPHLHSHRTAC